jgi:hypothetical protein
MKLLISLAAGAVALAVLASAQAAGDVDGVWVAGTVHNLVVTGPASPKAKATPLYVIAPISARHPLHPLADAKTHGFGAHDHVIALAHPSTAFHGACELTLVVPGPKAAAGSIATRPTLTPAGQKPLLYAARMAGKLLMLDSASRVVQAHRLGLATLVDVHVRIACTVTPR